MPQAKARHILVPSQTECESLKKQIEGGADFAEMVHGPVKTQFGFHLIEITQRG